MCDTVQISLLYIMHIATTLIIATFYLSNGLEESERWQCLVSMIRNTDPSLNRQRIGSTAWLLMYLSTDCLSEDLYPQKGNW